MQAQGFGSAGSVGVGASEKPIQDAQNIHYELAFRLHGLGSG